MKKKTLMIDLDGVLNTYSGLYDKNYISPIRDGAVDFLEKLSKEFLLILFTSRSKEHAQKWIKKYNIEKYFSKITNIKEPSYLMVDDRCVRFNGDFNSLINDINNFKVWYKNSEI